MPDAAAAALFICWARPFSEWRILTSNVWAISRLLSVLPPSEMSISMALLLGMEFRHRSRFFDSLKTGIMMLMSGSGEGGIFFNYFA